MERLTITGQPTPEEVAAVAAALLGLAAAVPAPTNALRAPAWARAARLEAVGQTPFTNATDARLHAPPTRR